MPDNPSILAVGFGPLLSLASLFTLEALLFFQLHAARLIIDPTVDELAPESPVATNLGSWDFALLGQLVQRRDGNTPVFGDFSDGHGFRHAIFLRILDEEDGFIIIRFDWK